MVAGNANVWLLRIMHVPSDGQEVITASQYVTTTHHDVVSYVRNVYFLLYLFKTNSLK